MASFDALPFLRAWAGDPRRVAAIAPSSQPLAELLTCEISATSGPVIELGPGTGAVTRMLLARGLPQRDLTLVECSGYFASMLRGRFPDARVVCADAVDLGQLRLFDGRAAGAAVSSLPLMTMRRRHVMDLLTGVFGYLRDGGALYQFTYAPFCPVSGKMCEQLGLEAALIGRVWRNLPPAGVYRIRRARKKAHRGVGSSG